jgi:hypothetical protein
MRLMVKVCGEEEREGGEGGERNERAAGMV